MNVLVCEAEQEVVVIVPSVDVIVVVPQPSVAVAVPRAALISEADGLQPRVFVEPDAVITGAVLSLVQLTVLIAVVELPQPSEAVKVLTCDHVQPLLVTAPSVNVTTGVLQAAVAVAEPSAALISKAGGLHPSVGVAPVIIMVGGLGAFVHVTVVEA